MQTHLKRIDRIIGSLANTRNEIAQNPEVELDIDQWLTTVEVAAQGLTDEVEEELK